MDKIEKAIMDNAIGLSKSTFGPKDIKVCITLTILCCDIKIQPTLTLFGVTLEEYIEYLYNNYKGGKYETKK